MIIKEKHIYNFSECLYQATCECGCVLEWEASFDADGTNYFANCLDCRLAYMMSPYSVKVRVDAIVD